MTTAAKTMFRRNSFPNEKIKGAATVANVAQPESVEQIRVALLQLQALATSLAKKISSTEPIGKTKHPGLGYFSAVEWLQFAEMHLRHHWRLKEGKL